MNNRLGHSQPGAAIHGQPDSPNIDNFDHRKSLTALLIVSAMLFVAWLAIYGPFGGLSVLKEPGSNLPQELWQCLSAFGDARILLVFVLPFCRRRPKLLWAIVLSALLGWLMSRGIKLIVHLPRPDNFAELALPEIEHRYSGSFSFPSGHTVTIFSFAGIFLAAFPIRKTALFLILAALVGYSRIMLGAHWPIDVLGGAIVGILAAMLGLYLSEHWNWGILPAPHYGLIGFALLAIISLPFIDTGYPATYPLRILLAAVGTLASLAIYGKSLIAGKYKSEARQ
jgi:membrane-associated phospholipid phosphatase